MLRLMYTFTSNFRVNILVRVIFQIKEQSKGAKFEEEIKAEQEERRREAEEKKQRQAEFKAKAAMFGSN